MGKSEVDLADDIDEINEHAEAIAAAAKRLEDQGRNSTRLTASGQRRKEKEKSDGDAQLLDDASGDGELANSAPELEVLEGKENGALKTNRRRTDRPGKKSKHRTPSADRQLSAEDDPWVTDSVKVRHSKKRRLKELSLRRELDRQSPYQKKDLVDEALDYIFGKYEQR